MGRPEGAIEDYLIMRAKEEGYLCKKFASPSNNGVPDRILIGHGDIFFIELKAPGEKPRKLQESVFNEMREYGAQVFVADTKDGIDLLLWQKRLDRASPGRTPTVPRASKSKCMPVASCIL